MPGRGSSTKPFAHNSMNHALKGVTFNIDAFTIHDMRRTASTRLHEAGYGSDVIEKALNHTIGGVRGVYNKAEYAQQRREMLQSWSDYVALLASEGNVLAQQFNRA
jgi:integrase